MNKDAKIIIGSQLHAVTTSIQFTLTHEQHQYCLDSVKECRRLLEEIEDAVLKAMNKGATKDD